MSEVNEKAKAQIYSDIPEGLPTPRALKRDVVGVTALLRGIKNPVGQIPRHLTDRTADGTDWGWNVGRLERRHRHQGFVNIAIFEVNITSTVKWDQLSAVVHTAA